MLSSLKIYEGTLPSNHVSLGTAYLNLGVLYKDKGELDKAETFYLKSLEIRE